MTKIVHCKSGQPYDIYIGRKKEEQHYGNPFSHKGGLGIKVETRAESIEKCKKWLDGTDFQDLEQERRFWILQNIHKLKDKVLGCFCDFPNEDCHGRLYIEMLEKNNKSIRLAVIGSRTFLGEDNYNLLYNTIVSHFDVNKIEYIVSGKARGADSLGAQFANQCKIPLKEFPADWSLGVNAGFLRNQQIIDFSTHVIAYWDGISHGTLDSIRKAKKQKKPTFIIYF